MKPDRQLRTPKCAVVVLAAMFMPVLAQDHNAHGHHHHGGVVEMDADGKRLASYDVKHDMDPGTLAALRAKIALYRGMTDMELNMTWFAPMVLARV